MSDKLALLRQPFPPNQISYLPKGGVKLAYVGHAALTDRLLDTDPMWTWEPVAMDERGLPALDGFGGMWIRLTICGVTRLGYGHAGNKEGGDAIKEIIGDALRNAAMRFGAALDLWHKGELHAHDSGDLTPALEASIEQAKQKKAGVMAAVLADLDLPASVTMALTKLAAKVTPDGAGFDLVEEQGLTNDEKTYLWSLLPSNVRSALKREGQVRALTQAHTTA
jgi:hypothetical protein